MKQKRKRAISKVIEVWGSSWLKERIIV